MASDIQIAALHAVGPAAQASMVRWGVPASVTLAQWIPESTWGTSQLALKAKNYFGIKAHHLDAPDTYEEFPTHEYISGKRVLVEAMFERYYDAKDSFDDHGRLLATAARYRKAMAKKSDPVAFALELQLAGYSNTPDYGAQLANFIRLYHLTQYDIYPSPDQPAAAKEAA